MLSAENAEFIDGAVTTLRYFTYGAVACLAAYIGFLILRLVWALLTESLRWLWANLIWPVVDSITYPVRRLCGLFILAARWYRRFREDRALDLARKRMRDLGY